MEKKKSEAAHAVRDEDGKIVTETEEILKAYEKFYEDLLTKTNKKTKEKENEEVVRKVEEKFAQIMKRAEEQEPKVIDEKIVENVIASLKRKKAKDIEGWNNEMVIDGGK